MSVNPPTLLPKSNIDDKVLDQTLRPSRFDEYIGQERIKENLKVIIGAAQKRKEPIEHLLLHGPSGLGKTSLTRTVWE